MPGPSTPRADALRSGRPEIASGGRATAATLLALAAIIAGGLILRLHGLGSRGFAWDEITLWRAALGGAPSPQEGPFSIWVGALFMGATRRTDAVAFHLPAVLFGTAAIAVAYRLGVALAGRRVGLLGAGLVAGSPLAVYYAQAARPYGAFTLAAALLALATVRCLERDRPARWAAYALAVCLSATVHLLAAPLIAASALAYLVSFVLGRRPGGTGLTLAGLGRAALATAAGAGLGFSWVLARPRVTTVFEGVYPDGALTYLHRVASAIGPGLSPRISTVAAGPLEVAVTLLFAALFAVGVVELVLRRRGAVAALLALTVALPLVALYATLGRKGHWDWLRYLTPLIVPYLVTVGLGAHTLARRRHPALAAGLVAVLAAALVPGLRDWARSPAAFRARDARVALAAVDEVPGLDGVIVPAFVTKYGDESDRDLTLYWLHRTADRPTYWVGGGRVHQVVPRPGRFGLPPIPDVGHQVTLPPGRYAVVSLHGLQGCTGLRRELAGASARVVSDDRRGRVVVCEVR